MAHRSERSRWLRWLYCLVRKVLELPQARLLRDTVLWHELKQESLFVSTRARETGFETLDFSQLERSLPNSATKRFFILGSGSSVNNLVERNFEEIRSHTSVGINTWLLHHFVPDIYSYEPVTHKATDHYGSLRLLATSDLSQTRPRILFLKPRSPLESQQLRHIPVGLRKNTFLYGRVAPVTRSLTNVGLEVYETLVKQRASTIGNVTLDSGASVFRMTYLALLMNFTEIVYVGVDLIDSRYFWEANTAFLLNKGVASFDSGQAPGAHETMNAMNRPFPIDKILQELVTTICTNEEAKFFTANSESPLASFMDVYRWGE